MQTGSPANKNCMTCESNLQSILSLKFNPMPLFNSYWVRSNTTLRLRDWVRSNTTLRLRDWVADMKLFLFVRYFGGFLVGALGEAFLCPL